MKLIELTTTIHGELPNLGYPCVLIRLAGCNLACPYCDATRATPQEFTVSDILAYVDASKLHHVLVTGGEPLLQEDIHALLGALYRYEVVLETNGTQSTVSVPPQVVTSMDVKLHLPDLTTTKENVQLLTCWDTIKFVYWDQESFDLAWDFLDSLPVVRPVVVFSPVDPTRAYTQQFIERCSQRPTLSIRLQIQIHKVLSCA